MENMTLANIEQAIADYLAVDDADADETERAEMEALVQAQLAALMEAEAEKIDSYVRVLKRFDKEIEYLKGEVDAATRKKRTAENKRQSIKDWLKTIMTANGKTRFEGRIHKICLTPSKGIVYDCTPDRLPLKYRRKVVEWKPCTEEIEAALKAGVKVRGARFESRMNVQIR